MRVLDLFCSEGGAAQGYHQAWPDAEIVGVDTNPKVGERYPFTFVCADAMTFDLTGFDFVHASPPCHDHSSVTGRDRKANGDKGTGWMLEATIDRLRGSGVPWIVENVEGAKMPADVYSVRLCGSSFGLNVRRHRLFASNVLLLAPPCDHSWQTPRFVSLDAKSRKAGRLASVVGVHGHCNYAGEFEIRCEAMGIDWMTPQGLTQAIPPAYTRYLAEQVSAQQAVAA